MNETVKLIIEIPRNEYEYTCNMTLHDRSIWDNAIRKGIPLDDVKAEIEEKISHYDHFQGSNTAHGLEIALEIIDKHISGYER